MPSSAALRGQTLIQGSIPWLDSISPGWTSRPDPTGTGLFLCPPAAESGACYAEWSLGRLNDVRRFIGQYRFVPFWLKPITGTAGTTLPAETLWLLVERRDRRYGLFIALLDGNTRYALSGCVAELRISAETGDPATAVGRGPAVFFASGANADELLRAAAAALQRHFGVPHRRQRTVPDFVDQFGWCTWDAFYTGVSPARIQRGLTTFKRGGVSPRLLIIDDGWQSVARAPGGEARLTALVPNAKFGGDLGPTVRSAKDRFHVRTVLAWHALLGYWGGLDERALARYRPRTIARAFGPGVLRHDPTWNVRPWGAVVGVPTDRRVARFFNDYHRQLARQGVDGVKVDNQAMLEAVAAGQGGRVALTRVFRDALEGSVQRHFQGRLINCMSCSQEMLFLAHDSAMFRSSDDFYPRRPETHGLHIFANAVSGLWFGEFMQPDWDMFQSSHPNGLMHATARVVSGGPLYVSDKPAAHDFTLLRKLVLSDGTQLRASLPGRPAADCLFVDPIREPVAYKIQNRNGACGLVGLFHLHPTRRALVATVRATDVAELAGVSFAAYAHQADVLWTGRRTAPRRFTLRPGRCELVSYAPILRGFAALGLRDKLNSAGAVSALAWESNRQVIVSLRDGGEFLAWSRRRPKTVTVGDHSTAFRYNEKSGRLKVSLPGRGSIAVSISW